MGSVEFVLRTGLNRSLRVFALGTAAEAHPAGEWRPNELVFTGQPGPGAPQAQVAVIVGTGSTPLAVSRCFFEDANLGYRFEVLPQIESDVLGVRVVCGDANTACQGQTRLIADSNAGPLALTVRLAP